MNYSVEKIEGSAILQTPELSDAPGIYKLISECKPLDLNSEYLYMILSRHFRDTCVIAVHQEKIIGVVTAYLIPSGPRTLFIWQIAVSKEIRGRGLARQMIKHILKRKVCSDTQYLEATVSPSNRASFRVFSGLSSELGGELIETAFISKELFHDSGHEEERLIRIGPIKHK